MILNIKIGDRIKLLGMRSVKLNNGPFTWVTDTTPYEIEVADIRGTNLIDEVGIRHPLVPDARNEDFSIVLENEPFCFEVGKYYRHTTGKEISVIGELKTTMYGITLIAETSNGLETVGKDSSCAVNWTEISESEWMKNFS